MADAENEQRDGQQRHGRQLVHLPPFWTDTPASWFALAESRFRIRDITDELTRFDFLVSSLTKESVRLVLDLVETPPEENPYTALKERLLSSHQLTNFQKIEKLHQLANLGAQTLRTPDSDVGVVPEGTGSQRVFPVPVSAEVAQGTTHHAWRRSGARRQSPGRQG